MKAKDTVNKNDMQHPESGRIRNRSRLILVSPGSLPRHFNISILNTGLAAALLAGVLAMFSYIGYQQGMKEADSLAARAADLRGSLNEQQMELDRIRQYARDGSVALAKEVAQLQARLTRLDALGERLTGIAGLDQEEFNFSQVPALGGPGFQTDEIFPGVYRTDLYQIDENIDTTGRRLNVLEDLLASRRISKDTLVSGLPTRSSWVSSHYGERIDPITGRRSMHNGVDIPAPEDSEVTAVASGVVVRAGFEGSFGNVVEIIHKDGYSTDGYSTLYGHQKSLVVTTGDFVKKGQVIGYVGSTGRSTGPHLHYEVRKDGKLVDPETYMTRNSK